MLARVLSSVLLVGSGEKGKEERRAQGRGEMPSFNSKGGEREGAP